MNYVLIYLAGMFLIGVVMWCLICITFKHYSEDVIFDDAVDIWRRIVES